MRKEIKHQLDTYERKNMDYKNSFHTTVCKYGLVAGIVRISDKMERIENLLNGSIRRVDDETLLDSIGDMATYCVMMAAECMVAAMSIPEPSEAIDNTAMVRNMFSQISEDVNALDHPVKEAVEDARMFFHWMEKTALGRQPMGFCGYAEVSKYAKMLAVHMMRWYVYGKKE